MKTFSLFHYAFVFGAIFVLGVSPASAATYKACGEKNIARSYPIEEDWHQAYIIQSKDDGRAWQRAILSEPEDTIELEEDKKVSISGIARANAEVQVYMYNPPQQKGQKVVRPGTCFETTANQDGLFSMKLSANDFVGALGRTINIDSFYRMEQSWNNVIGQSDVDKDGVIDKGLKKGGDITGRYFKVQETDQNYLIGTLTIPKEFPVTFPNTPPTKKGEEECEAMCQSGAKQQWRGPEMAAVLNPVNASAVINAGPSFDNAPPGDIAVGRYKHSYFVGTKYDGTVTAQQEDEMQKLSRKMLSVETIKHLLLGDTALTPDTLHPMAAITQASLTQAANGTSTYSPEVVALATNIHDALTGTTADTTARDNALQEMSALFDTLVDCKGNKCAELPTAELLGEIFPTDRTETDWAETFVNMLVFWTEQEEVNACILPEGDTEFTKFWKFHTNNYHENKLQELPCDWQVNFSFGYISPLLVLNTQDAVTVAPDFNGIRIMESNMTYSPESKAFHFPAGEKEILDYTYEESTDIIATTDSQSCITQENLGEYTSLLASELSLTPKEQSALYDELYKHMPEDTITSVALLKAEDIASRFSWNINGEHADIAQTFFRVSPKTCSSTSLSSPSSDFSFSSDRDGFEVGIIR